jgi:hypothetical protein
MISSPERLVERAQREADLDDLGPDGWQAGLDRLVSAIAADLPGESDAVDRLEAIIVARLVRRLRVEGWYADRHQRDLPDIAGPLVIVGLPRTGTTALNYLLARDERFRYTRNWELDDPVPPPDAATEADDPRRDRARRQPNVLHIFDVDGPAEDGRIHEMSFRNGELILPIPSYTEWWRNTDHSASFEYHERVLRLLHSSRPPTRWLLKNPGYIFQLENFLAKYPSARFIMTHRDPVSIVPSTCRVVLGSRERRLPDWPTDPAELGRQVLEHFLEGVTRARASRAKLDRARFLDVGQKEVESDPIGVAERVYEFAGLDLDRELRAKMVDWAGANQRGSRGENEYRAEEFGLTDAGIRQAFGPYISEFGRFC